MRSHWWLVGITLSVFSTERAVGVVSLQATSAEVMTAGEAADLCVVLNSGGAQVAGTQNNLVWDGSCAMLSSPADCRVNQATKKLLVGTLGPADNSYKALVLSLSDVAPIPDGQLYCCTFTVGAAPGSCCSVSVVKTEASDPTGHLLPSRGNTAQLCVVGGTNALPAPTPTVHDDPPPSDSDGCQISSRPIRGLGSGSLAVAVVLALLRRRIRLG